MNTREAGLLHAGWLPVALLIVVAVHQRIRVELQDQFAWKGGGFGMFSTIDARAIRCHIETENGSFLVRPPAFLTDQLREARVRPTQEALDDLAVELSRLSWRELASHEVVRDCLAEGQGCAKQPADTGDPARRRVIRALGSGEVGPAIIDVTAVRVEYWDVESHREDEDLRLDAELTRVAVVRGPNG